MFFYLPNLRSLSSQAREHTHLPASSPASPATILPPAGTPPPPDQQRRMLATLRYVNKIVGTHAAGGRETRGHTEGEKGFSVWPTPERSSGYPPVVVAASRHSVAAIRHFFGRHPDRLHLGRGLPVKKSLFLVRQAEAANGITHRKARGFFLWDPSGTGTILAIRLRTRTQATTDEGGSNNMETARRPQGFPPPLPDHTDHPGKEARSTHPGPGNSCCVLPYFNLQTGHT
ncbi:hypothetical protein B0T17DRAFT_600902 [Bombardia bombarda]|uniref:Uncharacterized protein n=1 Tax=Bombardia bombarda TaxID=252184 RepID=A0AA39WM17_9PEZI|nr:hypothetical protein B0T17DRAFT_600902 [Bombardia bombarda]